jgi:hypothetical protein
MSNIRNANRALIGHQSKGQDMANSQAPLPPEMIIATKVPANNHYGENGYQGPSSDLPGQHTTTGFAKTEDVVRDLVKADGFSDQTRKIDPAQRVPTAHGMKSPNSSPVKIQGKLGA